MEITLFNDKGKMFLSLEKDKSSDGAILKEIATKLNQERIKHASLTLSNRVVRISLPIVAEFYPEIKV
jgi:hypothetical protein